VVTVVSTDHDNRAGVSVWTLTRQGRTGRFVGWASVLRNDVVVLHPAAGAALDLPKTGDLRLRIRLSDVTGVDVIDGTAVAPRPHVAAGLVAVNLDFATRCEVTLPPLPPRPTPEDIDRLVAQVNEAADQDDTEPPPAPTRPGHTKPPNFPGLAPPWCAIWPHAWGCG
jgi:hypothetical protein